MDQDRAVDRGDRHHGRRGNPHDCQGGRSVEQGEQWTTQHTAETALAASAVPIVDHGLEQLELPTRWLRTGQ